MAYILGFIFSDGNIHGTTLSLKLSNKYASDKNVLIRINKVMESTYPVENGSSFFRLRMSNPLLLYDLKTLGVLPNKSKILRFPNIQEPFIRHFLRGYLDGDGWITIRDRGNFKEFSIGFCSGSYKFMTGLVRALRTHLNLTSYNLRKRCKLTKNKNTSICYQLEFYSKNAIRLIKYLYDDLTEFDLYLERKFEKQLKARCIYREYACKTKFWRDVEQKYRIPIKKLLFDLHIERKMDGMQMAQKLNVSSSTIYRLLENLSLRLPAKRGSDEWIKRVHYKR